MMATACRKGRQKEKALCSNARGAKMIVSLSDFRIFIINFRRMTSPRILKLKN